MHLSSINMMPFSHSSIMFLFFLFLLCTSSILSFEVVSKNGLQNYNQILLPKDIFGPESIAFCHGKGPYVSVSDGRILKWEGAHIGWRQFAVTSSNRNKTLCNGSTDKNKEPVCGRPLGLKFNSETCDLYIADAYFGILVVGPSGGVAKQLATSADGIPFRFPNALDIDPQSGVVYFTDSSILFQRRVWLLILGGDVTGRLMKYDPSTKKVEVLLKNLAFPNGVALSMDKSNLLVAESSAQKILRYWLKGSKIHTTETFAQLELFPDNIKRNHKGEFWVALNSGRGKILNLPNTNLAENEIGEKWWSKDPVAMKFGEDGKVMEVLDGEDGKELESVSEVEEQNGSLWIGSAVKSYVAFINV